MSSNSKFEYVFRSEPKLGKKSDQVFIKKITNGDRMFGQPLTPDVEEAKVCGVYVSGTILKNCTIEVIEGLNKFTFSKKVLTDQQRDIINNLLPKKCYPKRRNQPTFSTNPFKIELEQVKLYYNQKAQLVSRCKIKDLYCLVDGKILKPRCDILELDTGLFHENIDLSDIHDFPNLHYHLTDIVPEVQEASLYLYKQQPRYEDKLVNEHFQAQIKNHKFPLDVKIIDYDGHKYFVDLIKDENRSILDWLKNKYPHFEKFCDTKPSLPQTNEYLPFQEVQKMRTHIASNRDSSINVHHPTSNPLRHGGGSRDYFKNKLIIALRYKIPYISRRLFKVRLVRWCDAESFSVLPADLTFLKSHDQFIGRLECIPSIKNAGNNVYKQDEPFRKGELILFKNESGDKELGVWLRGIVEQTFTYDIYSNAVGSTSETAADLSENYHILKQMVKDGYLELNDLIYRIRSIDYGFRCSSIHGCMRHVENMSEFKRYAPWSMRCRLFGIRPLDNEVDHERIEGKFSVACKRAIDLWIRERLLDKNDLSAFFILHRCDILNDKYVKNTQFEKTIPITLFHRCKIYDQNSNSRKVKYDCLNTFLIDGGLVSDTTSNGKWSTKVHLDEHIVNVLATHNKLPE